MLAVLVSMAEAGCVYQSGRYTYEWISILALGTSNQVCSSVSANPLGRYNACAISVAELGVLLRV